MNEFKELEGRYQTGDVIQDGRIQVILANMDARVLLGKMLKKTWVEYAIWFIDDQGHLHGGDYYSALNEDARERILKAALTRYMEKVEEAE